VTSFRPNMLSRILCVLLTAQLEDHRRGLRGWLASFPLILFSFFPADRAFRQRSSQPGSAARSIAAA
jgi:hypothetical protein